MGWSRSSREQLRGKGGNGDGIIPKERYKSGEDVSSHWMQDVHPKKGALHRELGIPMGRKIPTETLEKATHAKSSLLRKRANLALRYRGD